MKIYAGKTCASYKHSEDKDKLIIENETSKIIFQYSKTLEIKPANLLPAIVELQQEISNCLVRPGLGSEIKRLHWI